MPSIDSNSRSAALPALPLAARRAPLALTGESVSSAWVVERITTAGALAAIRDDWNELARASGSDCLFLTWEWLHTWWKHCAGPGDLTVRAVRHGSHLLGIAPLRLGSSRSCPPIEARALQFLGSGNVGSDYLDLLVHPEREMETLEALATSLHAERRVVDLVRLRRGASTAAALLERLERRGWRSIRRVTDVCPYISLDGHTFESYLASLGASHRYNFRRRLRQLERDFVVRFDRVRTESERYYALETLFRLHLDRFDGRGGSDAFHTPELLAFHRELSAIALERDWLRLYVLRLDGRPAAALYGFHYGDRFLFYQAGFDAEFAKHSVGLVAMGLAIREAIGDGAIEYDLLHGDEPYKTLWARSRRELERIELFPPTASGHAHRLLRHGARGLRRQAGRVGAVVAETVGASTGGGAGSSAAPRAAAGGRGPL